MKRSEPAAPGRSVQPLFVWLTRITTRPDGSGALRERSTSQARRRRRVQARSSVIVFRRVKCHSDLGVKCWLQQAGFGLEITLRSASFHSLS